MSDGTHARGESTGDRELVHTRLVQAPREQVFRALADPSRLARWWGPNGFTSTIHAFDFRLGGSWRFVMHGPDGTDYPNESVFTEIVAPERVVIEHLSEGHHFVLTVTLDPRGDGTLVGWRQVFDTATHRDHIAPVVRPANEQNLDRLAHEACAGACPRRRPQNSLRKASHARRTMTHPAWATRTGAPGASTPTRTPSHGTAVSGPGPLRANDTSTRTRVSSGPKP